MKSMVNAEESESLGKVTNYHEFAFNRGEKLCRLFSSPIISSRKNVLLRVWFVFSACLGYLIFKFRV